jgi:hypothetical protein
LCSLIVGLLALAMLAVVWRVMLLSRRACMPQPRCEGVACFGRFLSCARVRSVLFRRLGRRRFARWRPVGT